MAGVTVRRVVGRRPLLLDVLLLDAPEQRRHARQARADDARVELDQRPERQVGVVICRVRARRPAVEEREPDDGANGDEEAEHEGEDDACFGLPVGLKLHELGDRHQEDRDVHDNVQRRANVCLGRHVDAFAVVAVVPSLPDVLEGDAVCEECDEEHDGEACDEAQHAPAQPAESLRREYAQVQDHDGRLGQGAFDNVCELGDVEELFDICQSTDELG